MIRGCGSFLKGGFILGKGGVMTDFLVNAVSAEAQPSFLQPNPIAQHIRRPDDGSCTVHRARVNLPHLDCQTFVVRDDMSVSPPLRIMPICCAQASKQHQAGSNQRGPAYCTYPWRSARIAVVSMASCRKGGGEDATTGGPAPANGREQCKWT